MKYEVNSCLKALQRRDCKCWGRWSNKDGPGIGIRRKNVVEGVDEEDEGECDA